MRSDSILIIMIIMIIFVLIDTYIIFKNIRSYQRLTFLSYIETFHNFIASCSERQHRRFRVRSSAVTSRGGCSAGVALSTGRAAAARQSGARSRPAWRRCSSLSRPPRLPCARSSTPTSTARSTRPGAHIPSLHQLLASDTYLESHPDFLFLTCSDTIYRPSENRHENPLKRSMSVS